MLRLHAKSHVKRLLKRIEPKLYHKWLKARLIKRAISDPSKPVYWESFKSEYVEVNTISGEMLMEGKRLAKAFHTLWQQLNEKYERRGITWKQREEGRAKLEAKAWKALEELKAKYDQRFSEIEGAA